MALKKKIKKNNGLSTAYHRIIYLQVDCAMDTVVTVSVASYVDEEYRNKEKNGECESNYITIENYVVDAKNDNLNFSNIYAKLKSLDAFIESTDC